MKSPFVRFSRCVRSPLSLATLGLCTLWGCRHLPSSHHESACPPVAFAPAEVPNAPSASGYEEPALATAKDLNSVDAPIASMSEGDIFLPLPTEPAAPSAPVAKTEEPKTEPMETAAAPAPQKELPVEDSTSESEKPAPNRLIEVPPEPAPKKELELDSDAEPQAEAKPPVESKELASVSETPAPLRIEPAKPVQEPAIKLDNEIFSLDSYCDGLVFDSQGFGYVSHKNQIVRFSPTGESSVWATLISPKGHRIEPEGTHLVCDVERRAVLRFSYDGKLVGVAAKDCEGALFRAPYDIAVDPKGGFYFTDPGYVQTKNSIGKLHYVDRAGKVSVVAAKIGYPTGIVYDAAQQRVLVAESQFNRILEFRLSEPGVIESHTVLVQLPQSPETDYHLASLCLDADGNLYVTQQQTKTVHVFDRQGRPAGRFSTGSVAPSAIALRSPDAEELFLAGEFDGRARHGKVIRLNLGK